MKHALALMSLTLGAAAVIKTVEIMDVAINVIQTATG
jgi:hypothetical protein